MNPPSARPPTATGITSATPAHAAAMAAIHRAAFSAAESWSRDIMLLQLEVPATFGLIHSLGGVIIGRVAADEAEVLTLAVSPGQRRRGIGSALLRAAMVRAVSAGAVTMFLEVAVTNQVARALYAAYGFNETGLRRRYYTDGTDALILRCTLSSAVRS